MAGALERENCVKAVLGSVVFLLSLFLARQILVGAGVLSGNLALLLLVALVGIPLGGVIFLETAFDQESRELRGEIERLRSEVDSLKRSVSPATSSSSSSPSPLPPSSDSPE